VKRQLKDCETLVDSSNEANKPPDLSAGYRGEERLGDGYQYWANSEEDEEFLDIHERVGSDGHYVEDVEKPRRKIFRVATFRRIGRSFVALVLLAVLACAGYFVFNYVQVSSAQGDDDTRPADAAIVLGAAQYNGSPSYVLQARLDHALNLYNDDVVDRVFVTGAGAIGDATTEGLTGLEYLLGEGVPESDIVVIPEGTNSWEQLSASALQIQNLQLDSVLLVSDGYHNYRLLDIADELGIIAFVSPSAVKSTISNTLRESAAVSIGRITGYRRLSTFTD
jgi:vancomycin permeability regulator SanA